MTNTRKNLTCVIEPQSGAPLLLDMTGQGYVTTASTGIIAIFVGSGGSAPYAYSLFSGSLPAGTTLDGTTGQLTRTGTLVIGTYNFVIQVQDSASNVFQRAFSIAVKSRLSTSFDGTLPGIEPVNDPYTFTVPIVGNTGTVTWSLVSGTLPTWSAFSSSGVFTSTASISVSEPETIYYFTIRATDAGSGETLDVPCSWHLYPYLGVISPDPGVGEYFTYPVGAYVEMEFDIFGGVPTFYCATAGTFPPGLSLNAQTGKVTGILTTPGFYNAGIQVKTPARTLTPNIGSFPIKVTNLQGNIQPQLNNANVGNKGPVLFNFTGGGVGSVTNNGTQMTVTIPTGAGGVTSVSGASPIVSSGGVTPSISHANSGVAASTYDRVTVNATGHVTAGSQDYTTIFTRSIGASLQYNASDFASMTTSTDVVRLTGAAGGTSTFNEFFASPATGQTIFLVNASTTTITIRNNTASGTAGSKFFIGADFTLLPDHGVVLWRDGTSSAWRIVGAY